MSEETSSDAAEIVQVRQDGAIAIVTLNYPQRRNAFSLKMRETLYARLYRLMHQEETCRAIVLTGAGNTFCAGGDISEMQTRKVLEYRQRNELPLGIFRLMVGGPKAIVAAVEGFAFGAGLSLAAACDHDERGAGRGGTRSQYVGGESADRTLGPLRRSTRRAIARRHRDDRGVQDRSLPETPERDRYPVRFDRTSSDPARQCRRTDRCSSVSRASSQANGNHSCRPHCTVWTRESSTIR